jgi:hypothetical protein
MSGIGASLTTFISGNVISSSAVNNNFSSLNSSGLSNDSGSISTSGGGIITSTGLVIGSSEHIVLGSTSTVRFNSQDVLYIESAVGFTDIQAYGPGGQIRFKDNSANTVAAIVPADHSLAFADGGGNLHDTLYVNTGANELYIQLFGSAKLRIKDQGGNDLASLDPSGNWRTKGTQTASVTP